ncbi:acetyl-CoA carboxylase biotin carboxyl carrier protein [soil metagenome]
MPDKDAEQGTPQGGDELGLIRDLARILTETGLTEIELERNDVKIRVARANAVSAPVSSPHIHIAPPAPPHAGQSAAALPRPAEHPGTVKSPMVGTAFLAPSPGAANFVETGSTVREGQTLLIIEAMKTMNQIAAPRAGKVTQILIENGQPVEYGEALLVIE